MRWWVVVAGITAVISAGPVAWAETVDDIEPLLHQGQIAAALERLEALLAQDPNNPKARFLKGLALAEDGEYNEAIKILLELTIDYPKAPQVYNNLGIIYAHIERYDDAIEMFKKAFRVDPEYGDAYENLGDIYVAMAGAAYTGALLIDEDNPVLRDKVGSLEQFTANVEQRARKPTAERLSEPGSQVAAARAPDETRRNAPPSQQPTAPTAYQQNSEPGSQVAAARAPGEIRRNGSPSQQPAAPTAPAEYQQNIEAMLLDWATAWSNGDADAYLAFYDKEFAPPHNVKHEVWRRERRERVNPSRTISIKLEKVAIELQGEDEARATFLQHYRSNTYKDRVRKQMVLKRRDGRWRIVRERSSPAG